MSHLDEELLLQFTLGTLDASVLGQAQTHLAACADCRALAAAVFATTMAAPMAKGAPTQPDRPMSKAVATAALARGTTLGRYVLIERLGTGGMGEVFAAFDPQLDRKVALKLLRGGATSAVEGRARLLREAQAMARLQHPNVAAVHDVGTFDDRVFIAMEFIDGETLSDWLRGDRAWRDVVRLFLQAGSGLAAAHHAGLIHRDFKPDNVLIGRDGRPRVLDFGLARQTMVTPPFVPTEPSAVQTAAHASSPTSTTLDERRSDFDDEGTWPGPATRSAGDGSAPPLGLGASGDTQARGNATSSHHRAPHAGGVSRLPQHTDRTSSSYDGGANSQHDSAAHTGSASRLPQHTNGTSSNCDGVVDASRLPQHIGEASSNYHGESDASRLPQHIGEASSHYHGVSDASRLPQHTGETRSNYGGAVHAGDASRPPQHGDGAGSHHDDTAHAGDVSRPEHAPPGDDSRADISAALERGLAGTAPRHLRPGPPVAEQPISTGPHRRAYVPSDSGLAALAAKLTLEGAVMGTPGYMAPEQLAGLPTDGRCDQFAFSVALYEALYGKRPFGGATLKQHAEEIQQGRLPPPPSNSPVPDYILGVIKRGLAANPADRYPDMNALLAELRPRRRRSWRTIATIAALSIIATAGVLYALWSAQRLSVCGGFEQRLLGVWDTATKQQLRTAFEKDDTPFATEAWANTAKTLDTWSLNWVAASREACEASLLRKVDSPALYEMKSVCLDARLQRLRALTHLLADPDPDVVSHAASAAASLDPVASCSDLEALTRQAPLDERTRLADARLQTQLAEARALFDAGKYARGVDLLRAAVTTDSSARAQAEGFLWLGRLMLMNGIASEAHAANLQAAEQAVRAGDAPLQAIAFSRLYGNEGFDGAEPGDDTDSWSRLAHAAASRVPEDWEVQYELALNDALVSLRNRKLNDALSQFERALDLVEGNRGPMHPEVASMHDNLGVTFSAAGNFAAAIEQFDQSYSLHVALEGQEHPSTALAEGNLASALRSVGRFQEAIEHFEHSLAVRRATLGDTHPETLKSFDNLAKAYLAADRRDEALSLLQRTLAVRTRLYGSESREVGLTLDGLVDVFKAGGFWREAHDYALHELSIMRKVAGPESLAVATALFTMGGLDTHLGNWAEARSHLLESLRIRRTKLGDTATEVAAVSNALGEMALAMGAPAEAFEHFNRGRAIHERSNNQAAMGVDLVGLGRAAMALNQPAQAVQWLERALSLHSSGEDPKAVAPVKLELGRALWLSDPDAQPRAKTLLIEAISAMADPGRREALAALSRRGITLEVFDGVDAGAR